MQQIGGFVEVLPSLYRMEGEAVYAFLPDTLPGRRAEGADGAREMTAWEIYRQGGVFLYLRYAVLSHQRFLVPIAEKFLKKPALLFVDNMGDYANHWDVQEWYLKDHGMEQAEILNVCGFRILIPGGGEARAEEEGISFHRLLFGKRETEECENAFFSWDGGFHFLMRNTDLFGKEVQIRYELDGYDSFTKRCLCVVSRAKPLRFYAGNVGAVKSETESGTGIRANLFWNMEKETSFICEKETELTLAGFPKARMNLLAFRFAKGTEEYYPAPYGEGVFLEDGDASMGDKGFFQISQGDGLELAIREEGYLGRRGLCAEVSLLKVHAPFYAAGIETEVRSLIPAFPAEADRGRLPVERLFRKKMEERSRPAYRRDVCFHGQAFEMCVWQREVYWLNLYGTKRKVPGIALCRPAPELSQALMADRFFVALDYRDSGLFTIPYTIDKARLAKAEELGYPAKECARLLRCYPKGQTFLGEDAFRRGIAYADCTCQDTIRQACHHFRFVQGQKDDVFSPDLWEEQGIVLVVKKGKTRSVTRFIEDPERWSFRPEEKEETRKLLEEVCKEVKGTSLEAAFTEEEWEGSIVVYGRKEPGGERRILAF